MKNLIIASFVLSSGSIFAADWNLKNESNIYDLMHLSPISQTTLDISYNNWKLDDLIVSNGTSRAFSLSSKSNNLTADLGYGVKENITAGLSFGYLLSDKKSYSYGPAWGAGANGKSEDLNNSGLMTPELYYKQRVLTQNDSSGNLDLKIAFKPKLGTSKTASSVYQGNTSNMDGNAVDPSSSASLILDFGRKYTSQAWKVGLSYKNHFSGNYDLADGSANVVRSSFSDLLVDGSWQWTLNSSHILSFNVGFGSFGEHTGTYNKNNEIVTWGKQSYTTFGGGYSYLYSASTLFGVDLKARSYSDFYINDTSLALMTPALPTKTTFAKIGDTSLKINCKLQF